MRIFSLGLTIIVLSAASAGWSQSADESPEAEGPPGWLAEHMEFLNQGSGCWQTSNAEYQSDNEPFDTYYNQWQSGIGGPTHQNGRLYGKTGEQMSPDFWDFVSYWDGAKGKVITLQFGRGGVVGDGSMWRVDEGKFVQEQVFSTPDGQTWKSRHDLEEADDSFVTVSSRWVDGEWQHQRSYTWHRCGDE